MSNIPLVEFWIQKGGPLFILNEKYQQAKESYL